MPDACTTAAVEEQVCEESGPPPGACLCLEGRCALRREMPDGFALSSEACSETAACGVSLGDGRCEPGTEDETAPLQRNPAPQRPTPTCQCREADGASRCRLEWFDPAPCRSVAECWVDTVNGHLRGIRRPARLRGRRFRPCVDGEVPPACVDGFCAPSFFEVYGC